MTTPATQPNRDNASGGCGEGAAGGKAPESVSGTLHGGGGSEPQASLDKNAISLYTDIDLGSKATRRRINSVKNLSRALLLKQREQDIAAEVVGADSNIDRRALCGRVPIETNSSVVVKRESGSVYASGLQRCGSVWQPCCECKIKPVRAHTIDQCYKSHQAAGSPGEPRGVLFLTLTQPHRKGTTLSEAAGWMQKSWQGLMNSRQMRGLRKKYGMDYIRCTEITVSRVHGWHVHYHCLLFVDRWLDPYQTVEEWTAFEETVMSAWGRQVKKNTGRNISREAQDFQPVWGDAGLSGYLSKICLEATASYKKLGKENSLSIHQLADAAIQGEAWAVALWADYLKGSKGLRFLTASRGFIKRCVGEELATDQEISEREIGGTVEAELSFDLWRLLHYVNNGVADVMFCWQRSGAQSAMALFHDLTGIQPYIESVERNIDRWTVIPPPRKHFKALANGQLVKA